MPRKTASSSDPSAHVTFVEHAINSPLSMVQMINTISGFFSANGYEYKPPMPVSGRDEVSVIVDGFPSFMIKKAADICSINFIDGPVDMLKSTKDLEAVLQRELTHPQLQRAHPQLRRELPQLLRESKRPKPHRCIPPPPPPPPLPVVPSDSNRQAAVVHGGLTIEEMTAAVTTVLDKHKYTYELPQSYRSHPGPADFKYFIPECVIQPHHASGFNLPQIRFREAYKATTMMSPPEKNTTPAFVIWHGFGLFVKTIHELTEYIEKGHAAFESDRRDHCEIVAEKAIDTTSLEHFIRQTMTNVARPYKDTDASFQSILKKLHAAAIDAFKHDIPPRASQR